MTNQLSVAPQGFWMKTHFFRDGDHLNVVAYSCIAGSPEVFRFSVDIRPIIAAVVKYHNRLHEEKISGEDLDDEISGWLDDVSGFVSKAAKGAVKGVKKAVSSPGRALKSAASLAISPAMVMNRGFEMIPGVTSARSAVMNKIHPQMNAAYGGMMSASSLKSLSAKSVVKAGKSALVSQVSGAVKGAVGGALGRAVKSSVSFPKVSMPAIGAFASANSALNAIKQANSAVAAAKKVASRSTSKAQKNVMGNALRKWAGATVKSAVAQKVKLPSGNAVTQALSLVKGQANQARRSLATIAASAKAGNVQAKQAARIVALAKSNQDRMAAIKRSSSRNLPRTRGKAPVSSNLNGFPALLVSSTGKIVPGRYIEKATAPQSLVLRSGKVMRGRFAAVSGDLDDVIGSMLSSGGDDIGSIGCSNPFNKPAHLR